MDMTINVNIKSVATKIHVNVNTKTNIHVLMNVNMNLNVNTYTKYIHAYTIYIIQYTYVRARVYTQHICHPRQSSDVSARPHGEADPVVAHHPVELGAGEPPPLDDLAHI